MSDLLKLFLHLKCTKIKRLCSLMILYILLLSSLTEYFHIG
jgi:hypothetical protein